MPNKTNLLLTSLASILFSYIIVVSINIINPPQVYKPQVLSETVASSPLTVDVQNTKLMASSQTLYETDILVKTTASVSAGFWYQGPNNPYGTSIFEDKTVPLKKDRTFHISALTKGIYEYFAVSFDNQNQKPPYVRYPETGTKQMLIGVTPAPSVASVTDIKLNDTLMQTYNATLSYTATQSAQATLYLYGPAYPDGTALSSPSSQNHVFNLKGLYKGTYEYYLLSDSTRYPATGLAKFEVK